MTSPDLPHRAGSLLSLGGLNVSAWVSRAQHPNILHSALSTFQGGAGGLGTDTHSPGTQDQSTYPQYKVPGATPIYLPDTKDT